MRVSGSERRRKDEGASLARSTAIMTVGTVLSRVTGVVRLAVIAAALGIAETRLTDAYNLANAAPNILYELILGGVVTAVFVPLFVELLETEERERAWEVFSGMINISLLILTVLTVVGLLAAPWIADFYASRLEGGDVAAQQRVITFLLRLFIPQIILYGLYFTVAGVLNAHERFGPPMFTPILNNLVIIAVFLVFHQLFGLVTLHSVTETQLLIIGLGTTASVAPMGLGLLPFVRKLGPYRLTLTLDHPAVRKLFRLSGYVVGFFAINQLGFVVIQWLANARQGGYTAYMSAWTFFLLPVGLFMWSLTTALVPGLSQFAVNQRWDDFRDRLSVGVRATFFLMLPATAGYLVLARPIVRVLLQHGIVTPTSIDLVAGVLTFLALGLLQFSTFQLFIRAFYAMQDTKTPFLINCAVVATNVAVNIPMFAWLGVRGLAAGQVIAYTLGVVLQATALSRRLPAVEPGPLAKSALRIAAAAGAMGAVVWISWRWIEVYARGAPLVAGAILLAVPVALGLVSYLIFAQLFRVEELTYVRGVFTGKAARTAAARPSQ